MCRGRQAVRQELFDEIRALFEGGSSVRGIARKLGLGRRRVERWVRRIDLPDLNTKASKPCTPAHFGTLLARRWAEGITKVRHLFAEIRHRGYTGSYSHLARFLAPWRSGEPSFDGDERGSLSKASRKLGQPLATVSRKVSELESHLKADLLIRSSKGLELTPAGRTYITLAKTILEQLNEAERAAAGEYTESKGDLVVTAPIMFGRLHVLPVVTTFLTAFPEVSVELMLTDRVAHFLDDQVNVALRIGDLPDSSLIATRLGAVRRVTCASPAYLAARAAPAVPQDLADHDVISFESVSSPPLGATDWTGTSSPYLSDRVSASAP